MQHYYIVHVETFKKISVAVRTQLGVDQKFVSINFKETTHNESLLMEKIIFG